MTILEYYKEKQKDPSWVIEYQSTAQDKHGKIFNCLNVNFRSLKSYYVQTDAFKSKNGLKRSEWNNYQSTGQEKDKQRIQPLKNAKIIVSSDDMFFITKKGKLILDINGNYVLSDKEKWLIMYMLILDFEFDDRDFDILRSVIELAHNLEKISINTTDLLLMLKNSINLTNKFDLFDKDIFWLISFANDLDFIRLYNNSSPEEKKDLYNWIEFCSSNENTCDCIAHKYISGGAYSGPMFNEDVNIILCSLVLLSLQDDNYFNFVKIMSRVYHEVDYNKIVEIIKKNEEIFNESYSNSVGRINKLLNMED